MLSRLCILSHVTVLCHCYNYKTELISRFYLTANRPIDGITTGSSFIEISRFITNPVDVFKRIAVNICPLFGRTILHSNMQKLSHSKRELLKNNVKCRRHPNAYAIEDQRTGDIICEICGLVLEKLYDTSPEWRTFEDDTIIKSRIGGPENCLLSSASNLATNIVPSRGNENNFSRAVHYHFNRRTVDRALKAGFDAISTVGRNLNLSESVVHRACYLYRQIYIQRAYKGNIIIHQPKVPACIYIASHLEQCARTSSEVCAASGYSRAHINYWAKIIIRELKIEFIAPKVVDFIPRFSAILGVSMEVRRAANNIATKMDQMDGMRPIFKPDCKAAVAILLANGSQEITEINKISSSFDIPIEHLKSCASEFRKLKFLLKN